MPRLNNGQEVFKYVNRISAIRVKATAPGDTTTTAAIIKGAASASVASASNFTNLEWAFIVGSGGTDLVKIGVPATTMPLGLKALFAQDIGARFVSAESFNLGHITEAGVNVGGTMTLTPVNAATSRTPIAYLSESGELSVGFSLLGHNNQNLALAFGALEDELGTGSTADPYAIGLGQETLGTQGLTAIRMEGVRHDGFIVDLFAVAAQVEVNVNMTLGSGQQSGIPVQMKFTNLIQRIYQ